jgi:quercetin dioxygenase-like cupin family protein
MKYDYFQNLSDMLPEIPPESILSRTFFSSDQVKAILFGFTAGQELSEHTASKPAILHFLQGEANLLLGSDRFEVGPGAWVHMPANLKHSVTAKTDLKMLLILLETSG